MEIGGRETWKTGLKLPELNETSNGNREDGEFRRRKKDVRGPRFMLAT
jgi:hypothetical protein